MILFRLNLKMSKDIFKDKLKHLVETFDRNKDVYKGKSSSFNEAQLRIQFLDPMFKAMGWDMNNDEGSAEQYKEVVHEDRVLIEGKPKAPDYSFRIGGQRKYFLEAKQPAVRIKTDYDPALQLRRYAWSAHLPISILTDFEEFAVYDTTIEPKASDNASVARISYYTYDQYLDVADQIYDTFAKESILKGSFDRYVSKEKRGTQVVDKVFLREIENWRQWLAKDLAIHNPKISVHQLNYAVQKIIDRIIFLRIAEDRGIETYKTLERIINSNNSYPELIKYFKQADDKYNSGLFDFEEDRITEGLIVSDKLLDKILGHLYYPNSPYEFSVLGVELLGSIYEQFLGKVIRLTSGHTAKVEEKIEVKKSGGIYYTPQYIVDYIVKKTLGEILKGKNLKQAEKIKILDPACGSGSFLIGAYEYLLKWYLDGYLKLDEGQKKKLEKKGTLYRLEGKNWQLTTAEKKRIMLNNIYGVDLDAQAVEVTKLSLALKMLENENQESLTKQLQMFPDRILPDLTENIKCGNSLISKDYWDDKNLEDLTEAEIKAVNTFDWDSSFPKIIREGGFDVVIGNPPYIRIQRIDHEEADYLYKKYVTPTSKADLSIIFIEKAISLINKHGLVGFISTSQWLATDYGGKLREMLINQKQLNELVDFGSLPVFESAQTYPGIFLFTKGANADLNYKKIVRQDELNPEGIETATTTQINYLNLTNTAWNLGDFDLESYLKAQLIEFNPLNKYGKAYIGVLTGRDETFVVTEKEINEYNLEKSILVPYAYRGAEVKRFALTQPSSFIIYPYINENGKSTLMKESRLSIEYPNTYNYLLRDKKVLMERLDSRKKYANNNEWYRHLRPGTFDYINAEKLIFKGVAKQMEVGFLSSGSAFNGANTPAIIFSESINLEIEFFLGLLNSKLTSHYLKQITPLKLNDYRRFNAKNISIIPVVNLDLNSKADLLAYNTVINAVKKLLKHVNIFDPSEKNKANVFKEQQSRYQQEIDTAIFKLYGLNKETTRIIEEDN
jgi:type I restriction-modification system DNA methylase subunit